jgi:hypothetical protein
MTKRNSVDDLNDLELLDWIFDQEFPWRDELYRLSDTRTLQGLVDFVRDNFQKIKQLENEKARINREA